MNKDVRRLGKNHDRYFGETIDIKAVLDDCVKGAQTHGWTFQEIPASPKPGLLVFTRRIGDNSKPITRIYISAGIHGDEPAGPLAVRQLILDNVWPENVELSLFPCLNPTGFELNTRENVEGTDLNRQYLQPKAEETVAHIAWIDRQNPFDLCL